MKAIVFPGQGSQKIGMGKDVYDNFEEAKRVFEEVSDSISWNMKGLIFDGEEAELNKTENAQVAIMTVSMALLSVWKKLSGKSVKEEFKFAAGHSLGEYSALCAASSISLADTAKLLKVRGAAMQSACPEGVGVMAAVIGLEFSQIQEVVEELSSDEKPVSIANFNTPSQIVISGEKSNVGKAADLLKEAGAKRVVMLPVSVPAHSIMMKEAVDKLREVLEGIAVNEPVIPIISNVSAKEEKEPERIKELLLAQLTGQVRWVDGVNYMAENGVDEFVEMGNGQIITGLIKKILPEPRLYNLNSKESIEEYVKNN